MNATFDTVLHDALSLPIDERSRIAARLIESVDSDEDVELSQAWKDEISRRIESARSGQSPRIPHNEVMSDVRRIIANTRLT